MAGVPCDCPDGGPNCANDGRSKYETRRDERQAVGRAHKAQLQEMVEKNPSFLFYYA